jgi:hypothetical protein
MEAIEADCRPESADPSISCGYAGGESGSSCKDCMEASNVCMRGASSAVLVAADWGYPSSGFTIECPVGNFRRRLRRHQRMSTPPATSSVTPPRTLPTIAPMGGVELREREGGIAEPAASPEPEGGTAELPEDEEGIAELPEGEEGIAELPEGEEGSAEPAASPEPEDGMAELPVIPELSLSLLRDSQRMLRENAN